MIKSTAAFVDRWDWVLLGVAAPFLLFPTPGRTPALLIVPLLWIAAWITRGRPMPSTPLNLPVLLLGMMVFISLYATFDIGFSLPKISGMVLAFGVFFSTSRHAAKPHRFWPAMTLFLALGLAITFASLLGTAWAWKIPGMEAVVPRLPRLISGLPGAETGFNANEVAGSLLWVLPSFAAVTFIFLRGAAPRPFDLRGAGRMLALLAAAAGTLLTLVVFILAQSRSAFFALFLTTLLAIPAALHGRARRLVLVLILSSVLAIGAAALVWPDVALYLINVANNLTRTDLSAEPIQERLEIWARAVHGIQDFPLTGMGMNTFRRVVHVIYPLLLGAPDRDFGHAHNEFLQAALDLGIPGLIAFLALYLTAFWMLRDLWSRTADSRAQMSLTFQPRIHRALILGLGGGLLAHLLFGLLDAVALGAKPGVMFWILLGLIAGLYSQGRPAASK